MVRSAKPPRTLRIQSLQRGSPMAEAKTKPTKISPMAFLSNIKDEQQREDSLRIMEMMQKITGEKPIMWGPSIIGFGKYHYKYESGHEGDCCITGFSPR